ncbi:putative dehydrogenase [Promicromonospora umidemergens]|uniref:Gfo/Idh/MocA family oxidoreductase n=1 Tax=Promicromonospora umidemergens TaxID=629679 RepID=A0ABP8X3Q6_9MICO|nr:Gfo/Idh/MocA family oxidoreductase [Promicromonospora umidemergens]MCP2286671.1 putative dehydrogenase [Promicromonospora umidemergens]
MSLPKVAVVGVHGHGGSHLRTVADLEARGLARLSAVVDPREPDDAPAPWFASLGDLLSADTGTLPDVVVLSTPIHTHLPLARAAMEAGIDVLLEKPTTASLAEHAELVAVAERTGRLCQVGFQTFGSHALPAVVDMIARGEVGQVTGIGAVGTWVRTAAYWARSPWAGRRRMGDRAVVDGAVTNPLAHAVATALWVGGARTSTDLAYVNTDLWRANPIEADDTSSLRTVGTDGTRYGFGLTLCAAIRTPARVIVQGTAGEIELEYEHDLVRLRTGRVVAEKQYGRTGLLENLLRARTGERLLCDARDTGAFMQVLEAVRTAADPTPIGDEFVDWADGVDTGPGGGPRGKIAGTQGNPEGDARHPVVRDVAEWCERAAREQRTFTELGAPWTVEK